MSNEDLNFKGTPWLGGLYQKIGKMYDEIDHSMSHDKVKCARNQLQTVGENVRKLGSHVMFDLAFPSFLASKSNSASSLGQNTVIKPKINTKVIDMKSPADAETEQLDADEFMSPSSKELSGIAADLHSNIIDDHWSNESREDDSQVGKVSTSEAPEIMCSVDDSTESSSVSSLTVIDQEAENETKYQMPSSSEGSGSTHADVKDDVKSLSQYDLAESSLQSCLTIMGQEAETKTKDQMPSSSEGSWSANANGKDDVKSLSYNVLADSSLQSSLTIMGQVAETETKDQMPSSSEGSGSTHAEVKDVKSLSPSSSIIYNQEGSGDLLNRIPFPLTTDDPRFDLPRSVELFCDPVTECAPDVSTVVHCSELGLPAASCQNESTNHVSIPSSSSSLAESLHLVEASYSGLTQTEGKTCEDYFDPCSRVIGLCAIPPSLDSSPAQLPKSYLLVDSSLSSFPGQSNSSICVLEDLPMEKVDLSDKVELDQRVVAVDNDMNLSDFSRRGCFNPYKKMFQNPFSSKKRLEKDYKLLSIWYGDIDTEFSEITQSNKPLNTVVQNKEIVEDTDWEIV